MAESKKTKKVLSGTVVSNKMDKTIVVEVKRRFSHPVYKRVITTSRRYKAHDGNNQCNIGDQVRIIESRPISRDKKWRLLDIVRNAKLEQETEDTENIDTV